jgi:hypothetical protein
MHAPSQTYGHEAVGRARVIVSLMQREYLNKQTKNIVGTYYATPALRYVLRLVAAVSHDAATVRRAHLRTNFHCKLRESSRGRDSVATSLRVDELQ